MKDIRKYIELSIENAKKAYESKNYPIGSVIVDENGDIVASNYNECATQHDIAAHAELLCIRNAGIEVIAKDVPKRHLLFSSLEPCYGCSFFLARTNIFRIYSALKDPHKGGVADLKTHEMFSSTFKSIELYAEPFDDLRDASRELMMKYFLDRGRIDVAKLYGYVEK